MKKFFKYLCFKPVFLVFFILVACFYVSGCAVGSATAAYAVRAGTADDLSTKARQSIIEEAVARCKK
jgi:hypothetical protein